MIAGGIELRDTQPILSDRGLQLHQWLLDLYDQATMGIVTRLQGLSEVVGFRAKFLGAPATLLLLLFSSDYGRQHALFAVSFLLFEPRLEQRLRFCHQSVGIIVSVTVDESLLLLAGMGGAESLRVAIVFDLG